MESGSRSSWVQYFIAMLVAFFLLILVIINLRVVGEQHFSYLANSFLHAKPYFLEKPGTWDDTAMFEAKYYRSSGILSALVMIPGVWVWSVAGWGFFYQGYIQIILAIGTMGFVWMCVRRMGWSKDDAIWLMFSFCCSSVFLGVVLWPWSWQFAQVLCVFLWWVALYVHTSYKNKWLVGIIFGLMILTRITAGLGVIFFILESLRKRKWGEVVGLFFPVLVAGLITGWYNQIRFGSYWESGQKWVMVDPVLAKFREDGEFSIKHVSRNLYHTLVGLPKISSLSPIISADEWGMGIFVTSPYLLFWFWRLRGIRDTESVNVWMTVATIFVPLMMFFSTGFRQVGSRYTLDFLPLVYWWCYKKLKESDYLITLKMKLLLMVWMWVNLYFFVTIYFKFIE